jgi:hypothetical protein
MQRRLLETFLSHWPFFVLLAAMLLWALRTYVFGRQQIQQHLTHLAHLAASPEPRHRAATDDAWGVLQRRRAGEPALPFSEVREQYSALLTGYVDELTSLSNLLLLTGVVGTLYGLYSGFAQAPDGGWTSSLAGAFGAFGVTISAVVLASGVLLLQRDMARRCDAAFISIAAAWPSSSAEARAPVEVQMVEQVNALVAQFQPVVARMEQHSDRVLRDRESLDRIAARCAEMRESVDALPASLRAAIDESRGAFLLGLRELVASWREHHAVSLTSAEALAASARDAHELYVTELTQVRGQNRELFAQVKEDNQRAFLDLRMTLDNVAKQVTAVDQSSEQILTTFSSRVTEVLAKNVALLDSRLLAMLDAAPGVERGLQLLAPTAATAAQQVESVQAAATSSVALMHDVSRDLAISLAELKSRIDQLPALDRWTAAAPPPPAASLPAPPPESSTAASPAPASRLHTFLAVALSAIAGGVVTELMRWA